MSNLMRGTPATASNQAVTAAPVGAVGVDIATLRGGGNTNNGPRYGYLRVKGNAGAVTIAADSEIYVMRGTQWEASGVFRGGKAIVLGAGVWAADFVQGVGDAERITLHAAGIGGTIDLEFGFYEESL